MMRKRKLSLVAPLWHTTIMIDLSHYEFVSKCCIWNTQREDVYKKFLNFSDDYRLTMCMNIMKIAVEYCEQRPNTVP